MRIVFWFRHDLRLHDNTGFHAACKSGEVIPCVIIDDHFFTNPAIGPNRCALFLRAVESLAASLREKGGRLIVRHGAPAAELPRLMRETQADALCFNRDYEPYAVARDQAVETAVRAQGGTVRSFKDLVVFERGEILTLGGAPYTIFTQYKKSWLKQDARPSVLPLPKITFAPGLEKLASEPIDAQRIQPDSDVAEIGEKPARKKLDAFLNHILLNYAETRDIPGVDGTSRLSLHFKYGTLSPRTAIKAVEEIAAKSRNATLKKSAETFISELIWRDFYFQVFAEFPNAAEESFKPAFRKIAWSGKPEHLQAWKEGRTGYPIVDAGMRQLRKTGWMHNRVRMITASFLCKDLLLDWREGERHFSRLLVDGEPAVNNGSWQWAAGTGTDAQPFFRIFNPTLQGKRFDPNGAYVREWIPELKDVDDASIHEPWEARLYCPEYPEPIVDHAAQREKALALYRK